MIRPCSQLVKLETEGLSSLQHPRVERPIVCGNGLWLSIHIDPLNRSLGLNGHMSAIEPPRLNVHRHQTELQRLRILVRTVLVFCAVLARAVLIGAVLIRAALGPMATDTNTTLSYS